jgi:serine protease Do
MKTRAKVFAFAGVLITAGIIVGLVLSSSLNIQTTGYSQDYKVPEEAVETISRMSNAMAALAEAVKPSVVNISTSRTVKMPDMTGPFLEDPFFRRFFGDRFRDVPKERKATSLGSGVIVDKGGYIFTNNHVIKGAEEIKVILLDKREFAGKVIGTDPKTDLAVVKIEAEKLPAVKWGDSDKLRVGETVVAIGNPYGLNQTVTSGIVSAVGRANVGIADYEDFIQTDAAINPGNSGGALVNARGELVGINTAIFSTTGGYQGIGFAIPSSMGKAVLDSLIKKGKVVRGWLGIWIQPVTPELAKKFGLKEEAGALVADVAEDGPAGKAGLKGGDFIIEYDGRKVEDPTHLRNMVANTQPDTDAEVVFIRDGKRQSLKVRITEQPEEEMAAAPDLDNALAGVRVQDITAAVRKNLGIPEKVAGVIVAEVGSQSPASDTLRPNDIIMEINRTRIRSVKDYKAVASQVGAGESVLLLVNRGGSVFYTTISP